MFKILTLGSDPEFFLKNAEGKIVSAIGIVPGTKEEPYPLDGGSVHIDNVSVELNVAPAVSGDEFDDNFQKVWDQVAEMVRPMGFELVVETSHNFEFDDLLDPMAQEFGCEGDFNAWTMEPNPSPDPNAAGLMRCNGGHIHIGFEADKDVRHVLVQALDLHLGIPLALMDGDKDRRKLYGMSGSYRPKEYGVEWRVPGNTWARSSVLRDTVASYIFGDMEEIVPNLTITKPYPVHLQRNIRKAIDNCDTVAAEKVNEHYGNLDHFEYVTGVTLR